MRKKQNLWWGKVKGKRDREKEEGKEEGKQEGWRRRRTRGGE